jgi:hypothetical protein
MDSEVDTSILNSVNIKRFTQSVLNEHGAEIDRSNKAKWEVTFPPSLSDQLDREDGTLVFDAADRELGAGDLLVQPGTRVFSALLDLVEQPGSVGQLRLTEETLQVNPPTVIQESELEAEITAFEERSSDYALAFHFRVQFETPSSFHNEEMFSVTVDPESQTRLPELTDRLTSHLPQLLEQNNEDTPSDFSQEEIQTAYEEAQQGVIDRSRPIIADLKEEADSTVSERIEEISEWYDQQRAELEEEIEEQRGEIRKWKKKRRKARKDSTRRKYTKNRKQAEEELERLEQKVQQKKQELNAEESEEIDEAISRNSIDVDVSLLGITEVSYVRGILSLHVSSGHAETNLELAYLPATDQFHGLDCSICTQDLTEGILPRLCASGHLVGNPCSTTCRGCGLTYCQDCEGVSQFDECVICWEDICDTCVQTCSSCDSAVCKDHASQCDYCEATTCHLCGETCATGGTFHCDAHLAACPDCGDLHCQAHMELCEICDSPRCQSDITQCLECDDLICSDHSSVCEECGSTLCDDHVNYCEPCLDDSDETKHGFCDSHVIRCSVGEEVLCSDHRIAQTIETGYVCHQHRKACNSCKIGYRETVLSDGKCSACRGLGQVAQEQIPVEMKSEFTSVRAGRNEAYMVILGKKRFGRNKVIVYDLESGEEVNRHSAGMFKQLLGRYE